MTNTFKTFAAISIVLTLLAFDVPKDWFIAGSLPKSYDMGTDKGAGQNGQNAATIKSNKKKINGFGTLMQNCLPDKYRGKRVRMSGYVKSENVKGWAGLWLRIDSEKSGETLGFDNMGDRSITGTTEWKKYEIVLDVPMKATNLAYGALLYSTGQIWFDNLSFEIVDDTVPLTGKNEAALKPNPEPQNLNFED